VFPTPTTPLREAKEKEKASKLFVAANPPLFIFSNIVDLTREREREEKKVFVLLMIVFSQSQRHHSCYTKKFAAVAGAPFCLFVCLFFLRCFLFSFFFGTCLFVCLFVFFVDYELLLRIFSFLFFVSMQNNKAKKKNSHSPDI